MSSSHAPPPAADAQDRAEQAARGAAIALRSMGEPNTFARRFDFWDAHYEWRRVFSELLGTFFLVLVAVGGGMVNARFGGHVIPTSALVVAPALMVMAIILFMGAVSGAHLNPAVSVAFAMRGDFPWRRLPNYIIAQFAGAVLATLLLWALIGRHGSAGLTLPGPGISTLTAMFWEALLTVGLVSTILGTASGAQSVGQFAAIAVGSYIALAGLWGSPVSGASMNPARSLGPALVLGDWASWWAYLVGPVGGGVIAVGIAYVLRGPGGGKQSAEAAQGRLSPVWMPRRIILPTRTPDRPDRQAGQQGGQQGGGPWTGTGPGPGTGDGDEDGGPPRPDAGTGRG
jgi:aquaporin Z